MQNIAALKALLEQPKKIVITAHANPDGDAIGSALGLFHYLKPFGHELTVIMPTAMPDYLNWLVGYDDILIFEENKANSSKIIADADIFFALDYNAFNRLESMAATARKSTAFKVMIDHHMYPDNFADAMLSDTTASSACQLVYEFAKELSPIDSFNIDMLNALYVGLLTDTGGYRHATSARLFRIVAEMLEAGVDNNYITDLVFNSYDIKRFELLAYCISDRLELLPEYNTGIISLTKADYKRFNIGRGDLDGVVNYILKIRQMRCAALITERPDRVKISMRSKDDFSVQEICSKYFNGGGHLNASGGTVFKSLDKVIAQFKDILENNYKEALNA